MTLLPIHSEFLYIWGQLDFLFYQCKRHWFISLKILTPSHNLSNLTTWLVAASVLCRWGGAGAGVHDDRPAPRHRGVHHLWRESHPATMSGILPVRSRLYWYRSVTVLLPGWVTWKLLWFVHANLPLGRLATDRTTDSHWGRMAQFVYWL